MKLYITLAGVVLAVLTGLLMIPSTKAYTFQIAAIAFVLALVVLALSFVDTSKKTAPEIAQVQAPQPAVIQPPSPPPPAENTAEAEIVAFFALLQEKGRLVDFLMEDLASYEDAEIGAAARVVHEGCKRVLQEHFKIHAIAEADEGSQITVPAGFAADEYRLVGKLSGDPPFTGKLVHKGWKTDAVKLPRLVDTRRLPAIAPAEVELESLKSKTS
ncbi:MAG TPA: DUF2760 domain-containing protein [Chthoniobacterales bacterium]|nr:DUF2760 domain-containing protein [Chthoniobacterales bacterium]